MTITPLLMHQLMVSVLAAASLTYEQDGGTHEGVLLISSDGRAVGIENVTTQAWYKDPIDVQRQIRDRQASAAVFATPAYFTQKIDGIAEGFLVFAVCPEIKYEKFEVAEILRGGDRVIVAPKDSEHIHLPDIQVGWLRTALMA